MWWLFTTLMRYPRELFRGYWLSPVGVFFTFVVPVLLTSLVKGWLGSSLLFWLVEGVLRTVIFLGYGTNESFAGAAGLPRFQAQYNKLLDDLAPTKARFVLLAPLRFAPSFPCHGFLPQSVAAFARMRTYASPAFWRMRLRDFS